MGLKGFNTLCAWILLYKLLLVNDISGIDVTPSYQKKFDTVVLTANTSGQTSVRWDKDSITLTSCFVGPGFCPFPNSLSGATIAIDTATDESTITIHSANQTFHGGHYEATGSTAVDILVNTLPVTVNWTAQPQGNLTSVSSATWTAKIYCVYPTSAVNVDFTVYVDGVKEVSSRSLSLSTETDSNCDSPEETVVAELTLPSSDFLNKKVYIIANASHASFPTEPSISSGQSAEAIFQGPTTQTSTVFLTERIPTTNYNNEYSNTNVPLTSEIVTPNSGISEIVTSINIISAITTPNSLGKETTRVVDDECPSSTLISMSSENSLDSVNSSEIIYITLKHTPSMLLTSPDLHTETTLSFANSTMTLMSNLFVSSFDSFSSEQHSFFSRTIIKTSFLETSDIKSNTLLSITDVLSDSSSTFTKLPIVLLTSISISASSVRFYSTPLSTFAVANSTNELIGSTVKSTDFIVERISVLTYRTTTTDLLTLDISNSGIISKTEITDTESYLLMSETYLTNDQYVISDSVQKSTHSYVSSEFLSQILRTTQPIISIDTSVHATDGGDADTTHYSRVLLTYTPVSAALMSSKHSFLFEITRFFSTISLSGITLKTSRLESSMYSSGMEDDIITTDVQNSGFLSSISINLSQSIGSSISMKTSNYLVSTSVFASNPTTTTTETRIFMSGYLQSSFYPTDQDFSLRTTDYFVTTMQPTNSFLVSSTEKNSLNVNSKMRTTVSETKSSVHTVHYPDMLTVQNDSLKRTIVEQSDLRTSLVTSKSEFEHQWNSSMSNHSFSRTIDVTSFITAQSTIRNSFSSLLYSSDSSNVILSTSISFLYATSSADFISTTIHSTSNTRAGISETTKSAIFITIVSVVVIIIVSFSSIMLLSRVIFERKTVNVSLSNESQFPYMERAIYPRFSDSLSSYMTSPYDRNWNEV